MTRPIAPALLSSMGALAAPSAMPPAEAVSLAAREHVGAVAAGKALSDVANKLAPRDAITHLRECLGRAPTMAETFALARCIRAAARLEAERWIANGADEDDELQDALDADEENWRSDTAVAIANRDGCLAVVAKAEMRRKEEAA